MYGYLDTTPPTALVDFNMTDARGVVPALRRNLFGLVPDRLTRGQRLVAEDADGNTSDAIIYSVDADVLELFLLPANPVIFEQSDEQLFPPLPRQYDVEEGPAEPTHSQDVANRSEHVR